MGCDATDILSDALGNTDIDEIDQRIASYEVRRMAALRAIGQCEKLARRLEAASSEITDGEFTEAAE